MLVAGLLAFFLPPLTTQTFFFRDNSLLNIPTHLLLTRFLRSGSVPLWNPFLHGGQPFLGSPTSTVLYPANLLDLLLPPLQAFNTILVLHYVLCAAFAYLLARSLGISRNASMVAGIVYALSGFSLSQANLYQKLLALPWIPFCLMAARQSTRERTRLWTSLLILGLLIQILANSPETTIATGLLTITFVVVDAKRGGRGALMLRIVAAMILAAGLAAIQLLPSAEMTAMSSRGEHRSYESLTTWSLHPARLPELLVPGFFGRTDALSEDAYWGSRREDTGFPNVLSIYVGLPALLMAMLGAMGSVLTTRMRRLLVAFAILGLAMACGRFLPGFHALYRLAPAMALFRYPVKAIVLGMMPLSLLAAAGADAFPDRKRLVFRVAGMTCLAAILTIVALWMLPGATRGLESVLFAQTLTRSSHEQLSLRFIHLLAAALALLVLAGTSATRRVAEREPGASNPQRHREHTAAWLAAIAGCDLIVAGASINPYAPRALFDEPAMARSARSAAQGALFYRAPDPEPFRLTAPTDDVVWLARFNLQTLRYYTAQAWMLPSIFHADFDGLANGDVLRLGQWADRLPWRRRLPILSAAGARAILAPGRLLLPGLRPIRALPTPSGHDWVLHENSPAARVRFVSRSRVVPNRQQQLEWMGSGSFDPAQEVLLDSGQPGGGPSPASEPSVTVLARDPDRSLVRIDAPLAGWVVYAEPFAPGWTASVDGKPAALLRANYAFSAVAIAAGTHEVQRAYHPRSFTVGLATSTIALLLTIGFLWFIGRPQSGASPDPEEAPARIEEG